MHSTEGGRTALWKRGCGCLCLFLLVALVIQATFVPYLIRSKIHDGIRDELIFTKDSSSSSFKSWQDNRNKDSVPIKYEVYFFNITSPPEMFVAGNIPNISVVGPYVYHLWQIKWEPTWNSDETKVKFTDWEYYEFDRESTPDNLHQNDVITMINPFGPTFVNTMDELDRISQTRALSFQETIAYKIFNATIFMWKPEDLFVKGTPGQLLFNGAPVRVPNPETGGQITNFSMFANITAPEIAKAAGMITEMYTGKDDDANVGRMSKYMSSPFVDFWNPPMRIDPGHNDYFGIETVSKTQELLVWVDSIFRNVEFTYAGEEKVHGVTTWKYLISGWQLGNQTEFPPNAQFYLDGPRGLINMSVAPSTSPPQIEIKGVHGVEELVPMVPLFLTKPFFLDAPAVAHPWVSTGNLRAAMPSDEPTVMIQPRLGAIFYAEKKLQVNVRVKRHAKCPLLSQIPEVYFPMALPNEVASVTSSLASDYKDKVEGGETLATALLWTGIAAAIVLFFVYSWALMRWAERRGVRARTGSQQIQQGVYKRIG